MLGMNLVNFIAGQEWIFVIIIVVDLGTILVLYKIVFIRLTELFTGERD